MISTKLMLGLGFTVALLVWSPVGAQVPVPCTTLGNQPARTFDDVPDGTWAKTFMETAAQKGMMNDCGGSLFCPLELVTRSDMAVFIEGGRHLGAPFVLGPARGVFVDVPQGFPRACWIEQFFDDGITAGCQYQPGPPAKRWFCPESTLTRGQMAVFLLKGKHAPGWTPDAYTTQRFDDVPPSHPFFKFINAMYCEGITSGCSTSPPLFCPDGTVKRNEMAVFLVRSFVPPLPTPVCSN